MRKLSLLLSLLLSFVSLSHASSGDITIGTKTYTQFEAQKQIVEPLLKRLERQKIAKTKLRLINLTIRQYTNKQKIAQKQGKTDLVKFYNGIIDTLKGKVNTIGTGSLNGGTENSIVKTTESLTKNPTTQSPGLNSGAGIGGNKTNDYNGMTQEQKEKSMVEQQVNITYNNVKNTVTKAKFLQVIAEDFGGTSSYAYKYAQTLSFGSSSQGTANQGGLGTTSDQTGLTGQAYDEAKTQGQVMTTYNNVKTNPNITKAQFLQAIAEDFGGTSSYAYKYAQTLSFENSSSTYNANHGGLGTTSSQTGLTGQALEESTIRGEVKTDYNIYKYYGATKTEFLNEIIRQYGKDSYAHKYAQTLNY